MAGTHKEDLKLVKKETEEDEYELEYTTQANYVLDKIKVVQNKLKACDRAIIEVVPKGRNHNLQLTLTFSSTGFEYSRLWIIGFIKNQQTYSTTSPTIVKDRNGSISSISYQVQSIQKEFLFRLTSTPLLLRYW